MYIIKINNEKWPTWSSENKAGKYIGVDSFAKTPFPTIEFPKMFKDKKRALNFIKIHKYNLLFAEATVEEI